MRGRKRRLSPALFEAAAPVGDASDPAPPPPVEVTGETASPRSIRPGLRQYNAPTLQQPPQPWLDQSDTPLPLRVSKEQEQPTATGGHGPPPVPPSEAAETPPPGAGSIQVAAALSGAGRLTVADTAALPGAAAFTAVGRFDVGAATRRQQPVLSAGVQDNALQEPGTGGSAGKLPFSGTSRIETDYANLLLLAISLEKVARDEIARLSNARPNDPHTIESNKRQSNLLSILADGFAKLAAALEEYSKQPQPVFAGKAKEVVDEVAAQFNAWWKANGAQVIDWGIRLPVIIASTGLLGWAGANMTVATTAVSALVGGPNVITAIKVAKKRTKRP